MNPLTCLFIYAHPDDESGGAGGTIAKLSDLGHRVIVVSATDGYVPNQGIARQTRIEEFHKACSLLRVKKSEILDFADGELGNRVASSALITAIAEQIDRYKPDVLVTFDHSGWYYHLDHIAVSLATSRAERTASHKCRVFLYNTWNEVRKDNEYTYITSPSLDPTHYVDITSYKQTKFKALQAHASQPAWEYYRVKRTLCNENRETFYLVQGNKQASKILKQMGLLPF